MTIHILILILALIAFVAAALGVTTRVNLTAVGLALLTLALLVG